MVPIQKNLVRSLAGPSGSPNTCSTITGEAATRGPAYERLLRHSNHLAKRVTAAHAHLHKHHSACVRSGHRQKRLRMHLCQHRCTHTRAHAYVHAHAHARAQAHA